MIAIGRTISLFVLAGCLPAVARAQQCKLSKISTTNPPISDQANQVNCLIDNVTADKNVVSTKADQTALNALTGFVNQKADRSDLAQKADKADLEGKADKNDVRSQSFNINRFWVLLAAVLVFFMQAGFKCLEVGMVGPSQSARQGAMKLFSWIIPCALYIPLGFGLMFGTSEWRLGQVFGGNLFFPTTEDIQGANKNFGLEFVLFQLGFAATAVSIVAGAIAERTRLTAYVLSSCVMAVLVYPIFGHWAWGGSTYASPTPSQLGWLQSRNFLDFAGSTVVHSVGAWFALVAVFVVGPRPGRFVGNWKKPSGSDLFALVFGPRTERLDRDVNKESFPVYNLGYAMLGVFMLWFGWWGFNGGSHLKYDTTIADTILNTNVAGAFAGLSAYILAIWRDPDNAYEKLIGGALGGLVAITASCNIVTPLSACVIGLLAGAMHNFAFDLLLLFRVDDPVGAIPVHGFCGVLGTLCVAFFKDPAKLMASGIKVLPWYQQLEVQGLGICVAFAFTTIVAGVVLTLLNAGLPMRHLSTTSTSQMDVTAQPAQ